MNVTVESLPKSQSLVTVEVEAERVASARETAFRTISREVVIPGFRKGKAPRHIVERYVRPEAVEQETESQLMDSVWHELREGQFKDVTLYDSPSVEVTQQAPFTMKITLTMQPAVQLGDYKDIRIAPELATVTDADVTDAIQRLREEQAQWQPVDHRPVRQGDMVTLQVHGLVGSEPIVVPPDYSLAIEPGSNFLVPGFAMRLVDLEIGKEQEFAIEVPEDAPDKKMAGQKGNAFVTIQEIKEKQLPAEDDEFAKTMAADNLDALKERVRTALQKNREDNTRARMENKILDAIAGVSTVSFPDVMVDRQVESMMRDRTEYFRQQGVGMDLYLRVMGQTMDGLRAEMRPSAELRIRNYLLVEELSHAEGIVVEDSAVQAEIDRVVSLQPDQNAARVQLSTNAVHEDVRDQLQIKGLFDRLIAMVTEGQEPMAVVTSSEMPSPSDSIVTTEDETAGDEPEKPRLIIATH
jgi:trigger factor